MVTKPRSHPHLHGNGEVAVSRYFALYLAQAGWVVLGVYLMQNAMWPSSCQPDSFAKFMTCSIRLAENRGWVESALMTWIWSSPLLIGLELSRRWSLFRAGR